MFVGAGLMGICARMTQRAWSAATRKDSLINSLTRVSTADLAPTGELVLVRGTVGGDAIRHPLEDIDVVQYAIRVQERYRHDVKGSAPVIVHEESKGSEMTLTDSTGSVRVPLEPITVELPEQTRIYSGDLPPAVQRYLEARSLSAEPDNDQKLVTVRTDWIPVGLEVGVVGFAEGDSLVSRPLWQASITRAGVNEVRNAHRSSAGTLKVVTILFGLLGAAHLGAGLFMLFAD